MTRRAPALLLALLLGPAAGRSAEPETVPLWPGPPPGLVADAPPEQVQEGGSIAGVSVPALYRYPSPRPLTNATAVIVLPGGGYHHVGLRLHGGLIADRLVPEGIAVFALKYRTNPPNRNFAEAALQDAQQAVRVVREHAAAWGVHPWRIGVIGYSAGSHLALNLAGHFTRDSRPDFVAAMCPWAFGRTNSPFTFGPDTPPLFICHARNDRIAPVSMTEDLVRTLTARKVVVEFEVFDTGGHAAFHLNQRTDAAKWPDRFLPWLRRQGLLGP